MYLNEEIDKFFTAIREDSRIGPIHISLFMAIVQQWNGKTEKPQVRVFSKELMRLAKISGVATYHRSIKELHDYGYINYRPSYNHFAGSVIFFPCAHNSNGHL